MELEEMQTLWNELSTKVNNQKALTDKLIMNMTEQRYKNKFEKIKTYETIAMVGAYAMAGFILANVSKLDTWYLLTCGIFIVMYIFSLPTLVINSLNRIKNISFANKNYKETLLAFAKAKQWLLHIQRLGVFLNFILMIAVVPVAVKLINHKNIFVETSAKMLWCIPVMLLVFIVVSVWGYRWYKRNADAAELLIKELDAD